MDDFVRGTTVAFDYTMDIDGVAVNIESDSVQWILKRSKTDSDAEAVILKEASKSGSVASFTLSPSETDLALGQYWHELKWTNGENVYIIDSGRLNILDRVFD